MLQELVDTIARPLMIIFQRLWQSGEVLDDWKKANIILVFKKVKKEDPGNYQPLSLTSVPGDVMEHLILGAISIHMEDKKLIRSSQYGFNKCKSCLMELIAFYNETITWMDDRRAMGIFYLNFSKAFDTVSHILIGKLRSCGLD